MGLLDNLKRALNIGGATVTVVTDDAVHTQGGPVTGQVHLQGGDLVLNGLSITLALREFWTQTRSDGKTTHVETAYETYDSVPLDGMFTLSPDDEIRYPFALHLPPNCRISTSEAGWQLHVKLDIPKAVNPSGSVTLQVDPARAFMVIVEACVTELGFQETKRSWERKTATTHIRLSPPETLKAEFDFIRLDLSQTDDGSVIGYLVCDLQEKALGDYLKAMFNRDKIKRPILLTHDHLFDPDGTPNHKAAALFIGEHLQAVVRQRNQP